VIGQRGSYAEVDIRCLCIASKSEVDADRRRKYKRILTAKRAVIGKRLSSETILQRFHRYFLLLNAAPKCVGIIYAALVSLSKIVLKRVN